ncbi:MAG: HEAT repeat domain-containing protein [Planctomycetes bacterium]|nr:HEAT repeat domain-containing protein [Planctomycetota bacterium]
MRTRTLFLASLLAVSGGALVVPAAAPVARAADDDPATRDAKARIAYFDDHAGKVKDDGKFADLVMDLADYPHALTVERVGRILLKEKDEEHQAIAAAALSSYKKPVEIRDAAGKVLVKGIESGDVSDYVRDSCIDAIGKIDYKDAVPTLNAVALKGGDSWVLCTAVRVMGELDDKRALPALLQLWERFPKGYKWDTGGEVTVDTGASGTADQDAAEAQFAAQSKGAHRKGKPPTMLRDYAQQLVRTVMKITRDDTIISSDLLRAWMEAHREELTKLGIEIPKYKGPTKKADDKDKKGGKDKDAKPGDAPKDAK